jgi:hypothetical protein
MKAKNTTTILVLALLTLACAAVAHAGAVSLFPSIPSTFNVVSNSTNAGTAGQQQNESRGYIYYTQIDESAPTMKWKAYVGNITGEYALQDASGNAVYDWTMTSVTGEIYATKEYPTGGAGRFQGGIPTWTNVSCANSTMISDEESQFNHTTADEDSFSNTFLNGNNFNLTTFYAGEQEVTDTSMVGGGAGDCYGAYLMQNNADQFTDWQEVVLTDGTYEDEGGSDLDYDIIYAALIENNVVGFDGVSYDFQILLPESGLQGNQPNTVYYFYVELV